MSLPPKCLTSSCPLQCCDINGLCPSIRANCVHFYDNESQQLAPGVIVAIGVGCVCLFTIFAMVFCFFCKKCKSRALEPGSPRRLSRGALPNNVIATQRNDPSNGTDSFQDLIMAENRHFSYPQLNSDPPNRENSQYFQHPNQKNTNPYYNS